MLLEFRGHRAIGSTDAESAVALVKVQSANVAVLDFNMPGMTGGDVCEALRSDPQTCKVRVVILSGAPESEIQCSSSRYDEYLSKPASSEDLFDAVERQSGPV